jgi:saccharopine dehydrogenase-like NADP-dependent oxidoreductase
LERIVVIGGTGHFGRRICRRIVGQADAELVATSRNLNNARQVVDQLRQIDPSATVAAAALDQSTPEFENKLRSLNPDIVIHTVGPYQGQSYKVAEACIDCGSHYIDLADGRDFVQGIGVLHEAALRNDVLLVSGASTLPGISSAVVDSLSNEFDSIEAIEISIAPAHQTPRGAATIAAVLSYCGAPFDMLVDGEWVRTYGWQDLQRHTYPQLGTRLMGACDVPDLELLPAYVEGLRTATFHVALEAKWEQIALWSMGWLTRAGIVRQWDAFVPAFQRMSERLIRLGTDVGGMHIAMTGTSVEGRPKSITWNLVARQNHGPEIPCSPALILARKLVADEISLRGARPCLGMISLADFAAEVSGLDIHWGLSEVD